jgi:NodT family efflux transporter outer membrane factor (OMF) lipoprotein
MYRTKIFYSSAIVLIFSAALLSCSVGKNYKRPELNTPQQYSRVNSVDSTIARKSWQEFFTDTTLKGLIDKALASNFDLQLAIKRIDIYQSYAKRARAAWLPSLSAQASASTNNPSGNSLNGISLGSFLGTNHIEDFTLSATMAWEVDVWGKIRRQKQAALADYLQTFEAGRAVQTEIVSQVADAYYNLLMMDAQLSIARRNLFLSDSIVQMIELQKVAGEANALGVQQAIAQQQNAAILIPQLEQSIAIQENGLRLLLGDFPGTVNRAVSLDDLPVDSVLAAGVPIDLLSLRPDVKASEQALIAANARVGAAQGNLYPALNLSATGGLNAYQASNWFTMPASLFGTLAGSLTQPIFQRRQLKTQVEVAKVEREQRVIEFRQSVTTAVHEVTNALVKLDKLSEQQTVATARVETLNLAVQNAQLLFRSGMANYLEVITAQGRALQAELDKAAVTRQQLSARVELYQSLGGGWR